jgi:LPS export ABC transporter protein LptC
MMARMRNVCAGLALAAATAACGGPEAGPMGVGYMPLPADQVMWDVRQSMNTDGIRAALLLSDTVYVFNDSSKMHLRGVNLTVYDEQGEVRTTVTSSAGELHTVTEVMVARGNVVVITDGGQRRIETEELHYDPGRRQVWSDVPFVMREGTRVSSGAAFRADDEFRNFEVTEARGTIPGLRFEF